MNKKNIRIFTYFFIAILFVFVAVEIVLNSILLANQIVIASHQIGTVLEQAKLYILRFILQDIFALICLGFLVFALIIFIRNNKKNYYENKNKCKNERRLQRKQQQIADLEKQLEELKKDDN